MEKNENQNTTEEIIACLDSDVWGTVIRAEEEAPGIFYLATQEEGRLVCREIYAVTEAAVPQIVSSEACSYGHRENGLYLFEYGVDGSGWELIGFELERYLFKTGRTSSHDSLYSKALYAAENYPAYFGGVLPPRCTPDGMVLRVKKAAEGLFFVETERCTWLLAVSFPIWECELSEYAQGLGRVCEQDRTTGFEEAQYLFFTEEASAPALYELLGYKEYQGLLPYISSRAALETKLYQQFLGYTIEHNVMEMLGHGRGDFLDDILRSLGSEPPNISEEEMEQDQECRVANCIHYVPGHENERPWNLPI